MHTIATRVRAIRARVGTLALCGTFVFACSDDAGPDDAGLVDAGLVDADASEDLGTDSDADGEPDAGGEDADAHDADATPPLVEYTEEREPCDDRSPTRNLYWGDTHIHTRYSFDAWVIDTRGEPGDAYAFARGEAMRIMPLDPEGNGTTEVRIDRPLDFAAVTDHSEYLAEIDSCTVPGTAAYDTDTCRNYRIADQNTIIAVGGRLTNPRPQRFADICQAIDCAATSRGVWTRIREDAEAWYDRTSACEFTTFQAYEYSSAVGVSNLHRNILFRNERTPDHVTSTFEEPLPQGLFDRLEEDCLLAGTGCDLISIPHNSNWSNGNLFAMEYPAGSSLETQRRLAERRVALEPIVEIFQHKGDSECQNGLRSVAAAPDELCTFEKLRRPPYEDCFDTPGGGGVAGFGCYSRFDFVRNVLKEGLLEAERIGANPWQLGIVAATDTHNATAGMVSERDYVGHFGSNEIEPEDRLADPPLTPGGIVLNPGGLMGVWSVENSRDALFEAMRRREVYGTSGPRIALRFFGGWDYPADLCDRADLVDVGYASGVPMGGELSGSDGAAPTFVVSALADAGTTERPGAPLQRLQVIKGWLDAEGALQERVLDVAGDAGNGADVDLSTCEPRGAGASSLCAVWTDPEFDPELRAFYYVRVVENPTCRWSWWTCKDLPEGDRPENCDDPTVPRTIQERAWSSPIWYTP